MSTQAKSPPAETPEPAEVEHLNHPALSHADTAERAKHQAKPPRSAFWKSIKPLGILAGITVIIVFVNHALHLRENVHNALKEEKVTPTLQVAK